MAPTLLIDKWMVAWTPKGFILPSQPKYDRELDGAVEVGPWPDRIGWSTPYALTTGCCQRARHKWDLLTKNSQMFLDFHTLVVRDNIDPQRAHCQFLKIDEYCRRISPDILGHIPW